MKDQAIFRLAGYGNLVAIATTTEDDKVWVRYYNGIDQIESITDLRPNNYVKLFVQNVTVPITTWCEKNGYNLWSY